MGVHVRRLSQANGPTSQLRLWICLKLSYVPKFTTNKLQKRYHYSDSRNLETVCILETPRRTKWTHPTFPRVNGFFHIIDTRTKDDLPHKVPFQKTHSTLRVSVPRDNSTQRLKRASMFLFSLLACGINKKELSADIKSYSQPISG